MTTTDVGLRVEWEQGILRLVLDRPTRLNACTPTMLHGVAAAVEEATARAGLRLIELTGAGRAFCAGADLKGDIEHGTGTGGTLAGAHAAILALRRAKVPVLGVVNGPAAGVGCALALACDLTVAPTSAFFVFSFRDRGLTPDGGLASLLPASIGRQRAMALCLAGDSVPAETAVSWGMIAEAVPDERFPARVAEIRERLASGPTLALGIAKQAMNESAALSFEAALDAEAIAQHYLTGTADHAEGAAAYREGRAPRFTGE